jgi:hypothetical protein
MVTQVGYSVLGRSGGRVTPCAICTMHVEMRSVSFLVETQNQGQWFDLKTIGTVLVWTQNRWQRFSLFWPQNRWRRFPPIWPKIWWCGFPGLGLKTGSYSLVVWGSKSPQQFLGFVLKTKQAMVYWLHHKTDGRAMAWDTH